MLWMLVTIGVIVLVVVLVGTWYARGRSKRRSEPGPMVGDLGTAEDIMRLDELHTQGKISDEEYHAKKSELLS
jgi:uncharacterized membrane protein